MITSKAPIWQPTWAKNQTHYRVQSDLSACLKDALKESAKPKTTIKLADLILVLQSAKMSKSTVRLFYQLSLKINYTTKKKNWLPKPKTKLSFDNKSINSYVSNGALHYARNIVGNGLHQDAIAGDNPKNFAVDVYYVFGATDNA